MKFKLAHVSDIHFFHPHKSPMQFLDGRFYGNFNYLLARRRRFDQTQIFEIVERLKKEEVEAILITGDLTCTATDKEFSKAASLIKHLKREGFSVYLFPGNHDVYTKKTFEKQTFYTHLENLIDFVGDYSFNLVNHRVASYKLPHNVNLVLLDLTKYNTFIYANGHFTSEIEEHLKSLLKEIDPKSSIILASHFPYDNFKVPKAHLINGNRLEALIKSDPRIKLYLHGHRHTPRIESNETHLLVDSGSVSLKNVSSHSLIEFDDHLIEIKICKKDLRCTAQKTIHR